MHPRHETVPAAGLPPNTPSASPGDPREAPPALVSAHLKSIVDSLLPGWRRGSDSAGVALAPLCHLVRAGQLTVIRTPSSWARAIAVSLARLQRETPTLLASVEDSTEQIVRGLVASEGRLPLEVVLSAELDSDGWIALTRAASVLHELPLCVHGRASTLEGLLETAQQWRPAAAASDDGPSGVLVLLGLPPDSDVTARSLEHVCRTSSLAAVVILSEREYRSSRAARRLWREAASRIEALTRKRRGGQTGAVLTLQGELAGQPFCASVAGCREQLRVELG